MFNCTYEGCSFRAFSMSELKRHREQTHERPATIVYESPEWTIDHSADGGWSVVPDEQGDLFKP